MKKVVLVVVLFMGVMNVHAQNIFVSGNIATNTVWDAVLIDTVKVIGDVDLNDGVSLTITPGIVVDFTDDYYFNVDGNLYAVGTGVDSIYFTTSDTSGFYNNTHHGWSGLRFHQEGSDSSRIEFASIQYGKADGLTPVVNSNNGGGIYVYQSNKVYISNVSLRNNYASALGGGVYSFDSHPATVTDNVFANSSFVGNTAGEAGGAFYSDNDFTLAFDSSTFLFNSVLGLGSPSSGGAIASNSPIQGTQPRLTQCRFGYNTVPNGGLGGALYYNYAGGAGDIDRCFFHNNQAGGGGAIYCSYRLKLFNSILVNNEATSGGGAVYSSNGNYFNWSMQNNTIAHNKASVGGGLYATNGIGFASQYLFPFKTIFYNNESTNAGVNNDFYLQVQTDHTIRFDGCSLGGDLSNCNQGSSTVSEMESLLSTDPVFVNPSAGTGVAFDGFSGRNWDVDQCSSPCVDPTLDWTSANAVDYEGDPRHTNATVDIGAYESYGFLSQPQDLEICEGDSSVFSSDYFYPGIDLNNSWWSISLDNGASWFAVENYSGDLLLSPNTSATNNGLLVKLDHDFGCGLETSDTALLTVYPVIVALENISLCDDSLFVGGAWQNSSGTYYDTLQSVQGCDSIIETNLTIGTSFFDGSGIAQICQGDSILIYGNYVSQAGNYYDSLLTINGCDSVYMTSVTVNPNYSTTNSYSLCPGDSIFAQGAWQQTTDIYYDSLLSVNGCDSVIISDVIMNAISVHSIDTGYCAGASVTINGMTYSTSGAFDQYFTNSVGCDSILTVNVTEWSLPNADIGPDTLFVCDGQELVFGIDETDIASYSISNFSSTIFDDTLFFTYDMLTPVTSVVSQVTGISGCSNSDQVILIGNDIINMSANFPTVNDPSVDFSIANMPGNVDFWYWSFGDGDTLSGNTNPTHVYTANGTYEACLIAENACGVDSSCFTFTISTVGLENLASHGLKIYPNPGNGIFNIINPNEELHAQVINPLGQVVKHITIPTGKGQVSLLGMPSGIYLLRFISNSSVYQEPVYLINQ